MPLTRSWVPGANEPEGPFPLNNLPCGVFSTPGGPRRCGVAIGAFVLDVAAAEAAGLIALDGGPALDTGDWCKLMARGPAVWSALRDRLTGLLAEGSAQREAVAPHLVPLSDIALHLPFTVTEYTDFYASRNHAQNVGALFRDPANALPPNWLHIPIGYNGRASSVVASGTDIRRPMGQLRRDAGPVFAASERLDLELEIGAVVGQPSDMGQRVSVDGADAMIFGYVLLNDWSARDIQAWEYQPLGPFQSKAFATTIGPWIVTAAALEPFRRPTPEPERALLPYLEGSKPGLFDIRLAVDLNGTTISRTNFDVMYYSPAQQLAHHTSSGCPMRVGDLLGSGTISGPSLSETGALLEMTEGGKRPVALADGTVRTFLQDGDRVTLRGHAQGDGYRIGFGDCSGRVLPAQG